VTDQTVGAIETITALIREIDVVATSIAAAKPRPASPARAASIVALSASRLVWLAMFEISPTMSPIFGDRPSGVRFGAARPAGGV
jgi:hypothetical protein